MAPSAASHDARARPIRSCLGRQFLGCQGAKLTFVRGDGVAERTEPPLFLGTFGQRQINPRAERLDLALGYGVLGCLDEVRIHRDRQAFLAGPHT
jgi:hypothetical protein